MTYIYPPLTTDRIMPLPSVPGIMTTQFIYSEPFDKDEWTKRYRAIMLERETRQTAEEYASIYFQRDTAQWLIAFAAFEAGREA